MAYGHRIDTTDLDLHDETRRIMCHSIVTLTSLLAAKGVFTIEEWKEALAQIGHQAVEFRPGFKLVHVRPS